MGIGRIKAEGTASAAAPCVELRAAYHNCFNRWYSEKFSKGQWDKEECVVEWDKYRACLAQHLEDKNLRKILQESEASTYSIKCDSDSSSEAEGTSH
ncbi:uncharacterized protein At4g33100 [Typha angustifolia]|uniref:uncharacterized protein At4g33100 n=1 Tax=Typha angustifolia TaxID=59011 RepID=UPI003C2B83A6